MWDSFLYFNITNMKTFNKAIPKEDYLVLGSDTSETRAKGPRWEHWAITLEGISQYFCCHLGFQVFLDNKYNENSNMKIKFKEKRDDRFIPSQDD